MFQSKDYIYEIYRCGSFSAAARNLYITQPAISIAVKKEEQELGQLYAAKKSGKSRHKEWRKMFKTKIGQRIEFFIKNHCPISLLLNPI